MAGMIEQPRVPEGLRDLMKNFTKEILKEKPTDLYDFSENYFKTKLPEKDNFLVKEYESNKKQYDFNNLHNNARRYQIPMAFVHSIVPESITELIKCLIKAILREQPNNLCEFAFEYFQHLKNSNKILKHQKICYDSYENYLKRKEHFLFTPYIKCTCGRILSEFGQKQSLSELTDNKTTNTNNVEQTTRNQDEINTNENYLKAVCLIQSYIRRYLKRKATKKESKMPRMSVETAAIVIQRWLKSSYKKTLHQNSRDILIKTSLVPHILPFKGNDIEVNDNISEAASYTSASTALLSAESVGETSEKILRKTIHTEDDIENDILEHSSSRKEIVSNNEEETNESKILENSNTSGTELIFDLKDPDKNSANLVKNDKIDSSEINASEGNREIYNKLSTEGIDPDILPSANVSFFSSPQIDVNGEQFHKDVENVDNLPEDTCDNTGNEKTENPELKLNHSDAIVNEKSDSILQQNSVEDPNNSIAIPSTEFDAFESNNQAPAVTELPKESSSQSESKVTTDVIEKSHLGNLNPDQFSDADGSLALDVEAQETSASNIEELVLKTVKINTNLLEEEVDEEAHIKKEKEEQILSNKYTKDSQELANEIEGKESREKESGEKESQEKESGEKESEESESERSEIHKLVTCESILQTSSDRNEGDGDESEKKSDYDSKSKRTSAKNESTSLNEMSPVYGKVLENSNEKLQQTEDANEVKISKLKVSTNEFKIGETNEEEAVVSKNHLDEEKRVVEEKSLDLEDKTLLHIKNTTENVIPENIIENNLLTTDNKKSSQESSFHAETENEFNGNTRREEHNKQQKKFQGVVENLEENVHENSLEGHSQINEEELDKNHRDAIEETLKHYSVQEIKEVIVTDEIVADGKYINGYNKETKEEEEEEIPSTVFTKNFDELNRRAVVTFDQRSPGKSNQNEEEEDTGKIAENPKDSYVLESSDLNLKLLNNEQSSNKAEDEKYAKSLKTDEEKTLAQDFIEDEQEDTENASTERASDISKKSSINIEDQLTRDLNNKDDSPNENQEESSHEAEQDQNEKTDDYSETEKHSKYDHKNDSSDEIQKTCLAEIEQNEPEKADDYRDLKIIIGLKDNHKNDTPDESYQNISSQPNRDEVKSADDRSETEKHLKDDHNKYSAKDNSSSSPDTEQREAERAEDYRDIKDDLKGNHKNDTPGGRYQKSSCQPDDLKRVDDRNETENHLKDDHNKYSSKESSSSSPETEQREAERADNCRDTKEHLKTNHQNDSPDENHKENLHQVKQGEAERANDYSETEKQLQDDLKNDPPDENQKNNFLEIGLGEAKNADDYRNTEDHLKDQYNKDSAKENCKENALQPEQDETERVDDYYSETDKHLKDDHRNDSLSENNRKSSQANDEKADNYHETEKNFKSDLDTKEIDYKTDQAIKITEKASGSYLETKLSSENMKLTEKEEEAKEDEVGKQSEDQDVTAVTIKNLIKTEVQNFISEETVFKETSETQSATLLLKTPINRDIDLKENQSTAVENDEPSSVREDTKSKSSATPAVKDGVLRTSRSNTDNDAELKPANSNEESFNDDDLSYENINNEFSKKIHIVRGQIAEETFKKSVADEILPDDEFLNKAYEDNGNNNNSVDNDGAIKADDSKVSNNKTVSANVTPEQKIAENTIDVSKKDGQQFGANGNETKKIIIEKRGSEENQDLDSAKLLTNISRDIIQSSAIQSTKEVSRKDHDSHEINANEQEDNSADKNNPITKSCDEFGSESKDIKIAQKDKEVEDDNRSETLPIAENEIEEEEEDLNKNFKGEEGNSQLHVRVEEVPINEALISPHNSIQSDKDDLTATNKGTNATREANGKDHDVVSSNQVELIKNENQIKSKKTSEDSLEKSTVDNSLRNSKKDGENNDLSRDNDIKKIQNNTNELNTFDVSSKKNLKALEQKELKQRNEDENTSNIIKDQLNENISEIPLERSTIQIDKLKEDNLENSNEDSEDQSVNNRNENLTNTLNCKSDFKTHSNYDDVKDSHKTLKKKKKKGTINESSFENNSRNEETIVNNWKYSKHSTQSNIGKQNYKSCKNLNHSEGLSERFSKQLFAETHLKPFRYYIDDDCIKIDQEEEEEDNDLNDNENETYLNNMKDDNKSKSFYEELERLPRYFYGGFATTTTTTTTTTPTTAAANQGSKKIKRDSSRRKSSLLCREQELRKFDTIKSIKEKKSPKILQITEIDLPKCVNIDNHQLERESPTELFNELNRVDIDSDFDSDSDNTIIDTTLIVDKVGLPENQLAVVVSHFDDQANERRQDSRGNSEYVLQTIIELSETETPVFEKKIKLNNQLNDANEDGEISENSESSFDSHQGQEDISYASKKYKSKYCNRSIKKKPLSTCDDLREYGRDFQNESEKDCSPNDFKKNEELIQEVPTSSNLDRFEYDLRNEASFKIQKFFRKILEKQTHGTNRSKEVDIDTVAQLSLDYNQTESVKNPNILNFEKDSLSKSKETFEINEFKQFSLEDKLKSQTSTYERPNEKSEIELQNSKNLKPYLGPEFANNNRIKEETLLSIKEEEFENRNLNHEKLERNETTNIACEAKSLGDEIKLSKLITDGPKLGQVSKNEIINSYANKLSNYTQMVPDIEFGKIELNDNNEYQRDCTQSDQNKLPHSEHSKSKSEISANLKVADNIQSVHNLEIVEQIHSKENEKNSKSSSIYDKDDVAISDNKSDLMVIEEENEIFGDKLKKKEIKNISKQSFKDEQISLTTKPTFTVKNDETNVSENVFEIKNNLTETKRKRKSKLLKSSRKPSKYLNDATIKDDHKRHYSSDTDDESDIENKFISKRATDNKHLDNNNNDLKGYSEEYLIRSKDSGTKIDKTKILESTSQEKEDEINIIQDLKPKIIKSKKAKILFDTNTIKNLETDSVLKSKETLSNESKEFVAAKIIQKFYRKHLNKKHEEQRSSFKKYSNIESLEELKIPEADIKSKCPSITNDPEFKTSWFLGDKLIIAKSLSKKKSFSDQTFEETVAHNSPTSNNSMVLIDTNIQNQNSACSKSVAKNNRNRSFIKITSTSTTDYNISQDMIPAVDSECTINKSESETGVNTQSNESNHQEIQMLNKTFTKITSQDLSAAFKHLDKQRSEKTDNTKNLLNNFLNSERLYSYKVNQRPRFPATNLTEITKSLNEILDAEKESSIPYEKLEQPCIKKTISLIHIDGNDLEIVTSPDQNDSTDIENLSDDDDDDSLSRKAIKLQRNDRIIEKMKQRQESTPKIGKASADNSREIHNFEEPPMKRIESTPDTDEEVIVVNNLQCEETRESSANSDDVVYGNGQKIIDQKMEEEEKQDQSKPFMKSVTIDTAVRYIEPASSNDDSFCLDEDTSQNIRRQIMAYSISDADSEYLDKRADEELDAAGPVKSHVKYDDFNISTALMENGDTSTETESTVVSAATKIQAGARGYLTRKRLGITNNVNEKKIDQKDENKASFGNAAISESLENLIKDEAAKKIQNVYRHHRKRKQDHIPVKIEETTDSNIDKRNRLAQKRSMLQRGDALLRNSTSSSSSSSGASKEKQMEDESAQLAKANTAAVIRAKKIHNNKLKWLAMRQNSMPVQIDSEVFRVIPKHMRKRISSAESNKKKGNRSVGSSSDSANKC